jgi:preprotein translocase subunit SecD
MTRLYTHRLLPILLLIALTVWIDLPHPEPVRIGNLERSIDVVRGLDLQGGLQVLLEADLPPGSTVRAEDLQTARNIIENRVNGLGVSEPVVLVAGNNRILVELPGIGDTEQAVATIRQTALLEFVELERADLSLLGIPGAIRTDFGLGATEDAGLAETPTTTPVPASTPTGEATTAESTPANPEPTEQVFTSDRIFHTVMTGADLAEALVTQDQVGNLGVSFDLTERGAQVFGDYTSAHVGDLLGIVLDGTLISAPVINQPITGGNGIITGQFTAEEANGLAVQLRFGRLPVPLRIVESKSVGPTLGEDSLRKSALAGVIGLAVVTSFMGLYYRLPGLIADAALLVYALLTFAAFKLIPVTLTLPGIAGFVLSIGVAVDANVLIFERMKEELRSGRTVEQAIELGFSRAWPSIRDSNLSTLITCTILYWFGSAFGASLVKGFSLTLALGVMASLFTAITVTRTFLHVVLDNLRQAARPGWYGI